MAPTTTQISPAAMCIATMARNTGSVEGTSMPSTTVVSAGITDRSRFPRYSAPFAIPGGRPTAARGISAVILEVLRLDHQSAIGPIILPIAITKRYEPARTSSHSAPIVELQARGLHDRGGIGSGPRRRGRSGCGVSVSEPVWSFGVTTFVAFPRFLTFSDDEPYDCKRGNSIEPPRAEYELGSERCHDDERKPTACNALNGVRPKCAAA